MKKEKNLELLLDSNSVRLSDEELNAASGGGERTVYYIVSCFTCHRELTQSDKRIYSFEEARPIREAHRAQYPGHDVGIKAFPED